jgi:hypothetical protein
MSNRTHGISYQCIVSSGQTDSEESVRVLKEISVKVLLGIFDV